MINFVLKIEKYLQIFLGIHENENTNIISIDQKKNGDINISYKETICRVIYKEEVKNIDEFLTKNELKDNTKNRTGKCCGKIISKNIKIN